MWLPEVVAIEKLHRYVRLQAGRKGGTSLLSCQVLDFLGSHCGPGVLSSEFHGVIGSKSRTSGLHFCGKCHHIHPTILPSCKEEGWFMFSMWT